MSESKSRIDYWYDNECILTVDTTSVPKKGEKIYFNTGMDPIWYDARFPDKRLFNKGIRGEFQVIEVNRSYRNYDTVTKVETEKSGEFELPSQYTVETFEVRLKTSS